MKIGILTFHWATNYGAILQAWCLQQYLIEQGHEVDIVNYKPESFDFSWVKLAKHPSNWRDLTSILQNRRKERRLVPFREKYLHTTRRYGKISEFGSDLDCYEILISGSDQVLNPSFSMNGENGSPSPVYWLKLGGKNIKRIGYSVSFGCEKYPSKAACLVRDWVNNFNVIGTREQSGLHILEQLGFGGVKCVTPDPTILLGERLFHLLGVDLNVNKSNYTCVYMLRRQIKMNGNVFYIDENHHPVSLKKWLETIAYAKQMVTNSYHGMLMAMFTHVPFAILLEGGRDSGMNDRFYTLLNLLECEDRIAKNVEDVGNILKKEMNFEKIDIALDKYRKEGAAFLYKYINI